MSKVTNSNKLSREEVVHISNLVRLQLSEKEIEKLQDQLGETLEYIKNLSELDTSSVKETAHSGDSVNVTFEDGAAPVRTFTQDQALKNAPKKKDGYFIVSKILNK